MPRSFNPLLLPERRILITGAGGGIGSACALALSQLGAQVVLCGRQREGLESVRAGLEKPESHTIAVYDLSRTAGIGAWLDQICREGGPLAGWVHCAGEAVRSPLRVIDQQQLRQMLDVHFLAAVELLKAASAKKNIAVGGASYVLISSMAGLRGSPGLLAYGCAKATLHALARNSARELAERCCRVNCIAPAYVNTSMLREAEAQLPGDFAKLRQQQFLGWVEPREVAVLVAYLLSDAARPLTGTVLPLDGGFGL